MVLTFFLFCKNTFFFPFPGIPPPPSGIKEFKSSLTIHGPVMHRSSSLGWRENQESCPVIWPPQPSAVAVWPAVWFLKPQLPGHRPLPLCSLPCFCSKLDWHLNKTEAGPPLSHNWPLSADTPATGRDLQYPAGHMSWLVMQNRSSGIPDAIPIAQPLLPRQ